MKTLFLAGLSITTLFMAGCATTPTPEEICSAEWIAPRVDRAMYDFKRDTGKTIKTLKKAGDKLSKKGELSTFQMLKVVNAVTKLGDRLQNGHAVKDLRTLAQTCNDPDLIKTAMNDFMREQGVPDKFISFLNDMERYTNLLAVKTKA
ncbi:MAG TPA: hypothetical protein ENJ42_05310 [Hellea balneolensis]|uniref:Lipoprotein n=1 Tax=Hellea balneolensis TaxID=287478 RepID=A0A7C5M394_9PROT|nr:hypothetical protein [Hellea balneolensis]